MILEYIPLHPRLRVLSFVCKQWRTLVLRSVRTAPAWKLDPTDYVYSLFPGIEEVVIPAHELMLKVPQGLQRLELPMTELMWRDITDPCCYAEVVVNDPRKLTSLRVEEHVGCRALIPLLRSCQSTLREVGVSYKFIAWRAAADVSSYYY